MNAPIFMRDFAKREYMPPDHRHWYRAGIARGVTIGMFIGLSIAAVIIIIATWR